MHGSRSRRAMGGWLCRGGRRATGGGAAYTPDVSAPALEVSGLVKRYGGRTVVDGLGLSAAARRRHRRARPERRGQDDHGRVLRGAAAPRRGRRPGAGARPRARRRPAAAADRRHAPGRRPADRGTGRRGARPPRRAAREPARPPRAGARPRARARAPDHGEAAVRRPAPAPRPRRRRGGPARGRLPRRADGGPRPAGPASPSGTWCARCARPASRSCSPPT